MLLLLLLLLGSTFEKDNKELDPRKAYNYLGIEESYDIQYIIIIHLIILEHEIDSHQF